MAQREIPPTHVDAIGERLRITRLALGLNQAELCRRTGIGTNTYNQWEKKKGRPDLDGALKLCDALDITLDWIYRGRLAAMPNDLATRIRELKASETKRTAHHIRAVS